MMDIGLLKKKFLQKFPLASDYSPQQLPDSLNRVPMKYFLENENIVTGNFVERTRKEGPLADLEVKD